jgi:hypothetical protein
MKYIFKNQIFPRNYIVFGKIFEANTLIVAILLW